MLSWFQTEQLGIEVDLLVDDVERAVERFVVAGGTLVSGPFETEIGRCAVVADPWRNTLVLLDMSQGSLPETRREENSVTDGSG
jgi:predicted enzyme related to lactoylglutathione lyase